MILRPWRAEFLFCSRWLSRRAGYRHGGRLDSIQWRRCGTINSPSTTLAVARLAGRGQATAHFAGKTSEPLLRRGAYMARMKAVQVPKAGADFEVVEREIPEPRAGQVRIRVQACGVCHSDSVTKEGLFPGISYPRVPGHEIAGLIDAVGQGVTTWKAGERVGVGWHGGQDGTCLSCRRGDFVTCEHELICGI